MPIGGLREVGVSIGIREVGVSIGGLSEVGVSVGLREVGVSRFFPDLSPDSTCTIPVPPTPEI